MRGVAAGIAALLVAPFLAGGTPAGTTISVTVTELRSVKGVVRACMSANPKLFLECEEDPRAYTATVPAAATTRFAFKGVIPGKYAIAVAHDENDNGKVDRVLGFMPKEGFGFSRDARLKMGPPSFEDAAIDVGSDAAQYSIRMRYML